LCTVRGDTLLHKRFHIGGQVLRARRQPFLGTGEVEARKQRVVQLTHLAPPAFRAFGLALEDEEIALSTQPAAQARPCARKRLVRDLCHDAIIAWALAYDDEVARDIRRGGRRATTPPRCIPRVWPGGEPARLRAAWS